MAIINGWLQQWKFYCLTVPEIRSRKSGYQQGLFLLKAVREASVSGLSPWLVECCLLPVSSCHLSSMHVSVPKFALFIGTPMIYSKQSLFWPGSTLWFWQQSYHGTVFPPHSTPRDWLLQSHVPHSLPGCPEWPTRGFISGR